jgi:chromosome segregation ATPase
MKNRDILVDISQYRKLDPAVLLLSEIEILVAQTRLIEVYVKQAKAMAEMETARVHEQYQSQLAALTAEMGEKENLLSDLRTKLHETDGLAQNQLQALRNQLQEQRSVLDHRNDEIQRTESELASLRAQILRLESSQNEKEAAVQDAQRTRERLEADLARLRDELEKASLELQEQRGVSRDREEGLRRELQELTTRLAEQEKRGGAKESQLREAGEEITRLLQRVDELELDRNEASARAARESEQIRATFEGQLAELHAALEQKHRSFQEGQLVLAEIERGLKTEIDELRHKLTDKQQRLEARENELEELRAHLATLQERVLQAEAAIQQSITAAQDSERIRQELESEIVGLRSEVAAKEQALADRQAAVAALEETLRSRIEELQRQREQARGLLEAKDGEVQRTQSEIEFLRGRVSELETAAETAGLTTIRETEELRQRFATDRAGLQATLAEKELALAEQEQSFKSLQTRLTGKLDDLRARLAARDAHWDSQTSELQQAHADIATLLEQKSRLELLQTQTERLLSAQADQIRQQVRAELATLEDRLNEKDQMLQAAQQRTAQSEEHFNAKVSELQLQLAEKQLLLETRNSEVENLKVHISGLSEQVSRVESDNRRVEADAASTADGLRNELLSIREQFRQTELMLEAQRAKAISLEEARALEVCELQEQFALTRRSVEDREHLLETARGEVAALQERLDQLALSNQQDKAAAAHQAEEARTVHQVEMETLRSELQQKEWALAQRQAALENLAQGHKAQIQKLEAKALEQQQFFQSRSRELEKAQSEAAALRDRISQLETAVEHAELNGGYRAAQVQQHYEDRLAALQAELEQRTLELNERRSLDQSESILRTELQRLRIETQEKHALLENRNEEVLLAKSKMDLLQERFNQLEAEARQNEEGSANEIERMRTEFQAQLALLQAELSQKEWALDERQAIVNGLEQNLSAQIEDLRTRLAEKEALLETRAEASLLKKIQLTWAQRERLQQVETLVGAVTAAENSFSASTKRRWRTGFGWKKRWGS